MCRRRRSPKPNLLRIPYGLMAAGKRRVVPFSRKLALNRWLLGLFGSESLNELAEQLKREQLVGLEDDKVHRFLAELRLHVPRAQRPELPDDRLLEADQRIVAVTQRINEPRIRHSKPEIRWLYFQYLALLATDIYLDRWFRDPGKLLGELNAAIEALNRDLPTRNT